MAIVSKKISIKDVADVQRVMIPLANGARKLLGRFAIQVAGFETYHSDNGDGVGVIGSGCVFAVDDAGNETGNRVEGRTIYLPAMATEMLYDSCRSAGVIVKTEEIPARKNAEDQRPTVRYAVDPIQPVVVDVYGVRSEKSATGYSYAFEPHALNTAKVDVFASMLDAVRKSQVAALPPASNPEPEPKPKTTPKPPKKR